MGDTGNDKQPVWVRAGRWYQSYLMDRPVGIPCYLLWWVSTALSLLGMAYALTTPGLEYLPGLLCFMAFTVLYNSTIGRTYAVVTTHRRKKAARHARNQDLARQAA